MWGLLILQYSQIYKYTKTVIFSHFTENLVQMSSVMTGKTLCKLYLRIQEHILQEAPDDSFIKG